VVAAAGIDQDGVAGGPHQKRLEAHLQAAVRREIAVRQHFSAMCEHVVGQIGKEGLRVEERPLEIHHAIDREIADVELRH
jgi:hypothetical protein